MSDYFKNDGRPHPYNHVYLDDICETQEQVFMLMREELPGVDEKWFINEYMTSRTRRLLDDGNPIMANRYPRELIYTFIHNECSGEYKHGSEWGGFLPGWTGYMYSLYQWLYNIPSSALINLFPTDTMEKLWQPFHTICYEAAVEKMYERKPCK